MLAVSSCNWLLVANKRNIFLYNPYKVHSHIPHFEPVSLGASESLQSRSRTSQALLFTVLQDRRKEKSWSKLARVVWVLGKCRVPGPDGALPCFSSWH